MSVGMPFLTLGITGAIVKYHPFLSAETKNPKGLFNAFLMPVVLAFILFSVAFYLLRDQFLYLYEDTRLMPQFYLALIPLIFFDALFELLKRYVNAHLDTVFVSFLEDILLRLVVITDLLLFYFNLISFQTFILIFVGNYGFQFAVLYFYGWRQGYLNFSISTDFISPKLIKTIGEFSFFSFLGGITVLLVGNIDMLMISSMIGLSEVGIYAIAFYVGSIISIPSRAVLKISLPLISVGFEKNDLNQISTIYKQTSNNQYLFGLLLFIGVWANIDNLYMILPKEYATASSVILVIGAANLVDMITGSCSQILMCSPHYKFGLYFSLILVFLTILLNWIMIPLYGILGAAMATATSIFLINVMKVIFIRIKMNLQPLSINSLYISLIGGAILYASFYIPSPENFYLDIIIRSFLIAGSYLGLILLFRLSDEFNQAFSEIYKKYFG